MNYNKRRTLREDTQNGTKDKEIIHEGLEYGYEYRDNSGCYESSKNAGYSASQASEHGGKPNRSTKRR